MKLKSSYNLLVIPILSFLLTSCGLGFLFQDSGPVYFDVSQYYGWVENEQGEQGEQGGGSVQLIEEPEDICLEGIQASFTILKDNTVYQTPVLKKGEAYHQKAEGSYGPNDTIRAEVNCFEANNVQGKLIIEGSITSAETYLINLQPIRNRGIQIIRKDSRQCIEQLAEQVEQKYDIRIIEKIEPVPCLTGAFYFTYDF